MLPCQKLLTKSFGMFMYFITKFFKIKMVSACYKKIVIGMRRCWPILSSLFCNGVLCSCIFHIIILNALKIRAGIYKQESQIMLTKSAS